jgi:hypothetical protein
VVQPLAPSRQLRFPVSGLPIAPLDDGGCPIFVFRIGLASQNFVILSAAKNPRISHCRGIPKQGHTISKSALMGPGRGFARFYLAQEPDYGYAEEAKEGKPAEDVNEGPERGLALELLV